MTWGKSSCPFAAIPATRAGTAYPECDTWNDAVVRELREDPPEVVVTSGVATAAWVDGTADRVALVEGYAARWRVLMTEGTRVIVVGDSPASPDDLDVCAARHPRELSRCAFDAVPAVARSALPLQREAVASSGGGVALLDLTTWICPQRRCTAVIGHVAVHRAGDHITATYAATLATQLAAGRGRRTRGVTSGGATAGLGTAARTGNLDPRSASA